MSITHNLLSADLHGETPTFHTDEMMPKWQKDFLRGLLLNYCILYVYCMSMEGNLVR